MCAGSVQQSQTFSIGAPTMLSIVITSLFISVSFMCRFRIRRIVSIETSYEVDSLCLGAFTMIITRMPPVLPISAFGIQAESGSSMLLRFPSVSTNEA
jgi:hypothetical protein